MFKRRNGWNFPVPVYLSIQVIMLIAGTSETINSKKKAKTVQTLLVGS